ncbi:MAG: hypothetical protein II232_07340, partial [Spirochaetaceae bacterium]|nr:hypothetical protein [Spirochaetaceae bacterium]
QITKWQEMIKPYINSPNLRYHDTSSYIEDKSATDSWADTYRDYKLINSGEWNYFTVRQNAIKAYLNPSSENTLTLNAGKGYFCTENGDVQTLSYTFATGDKLGEILERNDFSWSLFSTHDGIEDYWIYFSYEEEDGLYYYRNCFVDSEGNDIDRNYSFYESTTLDTKYNKMHEVTLDFNGVEYNGKTSVKRMIPEYLPIAGFTSGVLPDILDDKVFTGWSYDQEGKDIADYLDLNLFKSDRTLYAVWIAKDELVLPYEFNGDVTITFTYNPEHFDSNVVGSYSENAEVYLMFPGSNWQPNEYYKLTRQNDGIYAKTFNWGDDIKPGFDTWNGYKFFIKEGDQNNWLGAEEYKFSLPDIYAQPDEDRNFRLVY